MADTDLADDIYPNDSESMGMYDDEPDTDSAPVQEQHQMASSYPIMDELLAWFDGKISYYSSLDSVTVDDKMDDYNIAREVMVNRQIQNVLTSKRNELHSKFSAYKQSMNPQPGDNNE